jgi:hypothetical protein
MLQSLKLLEQTLDFWIQGMQPVKPKQIFLLPPPLPPTPPPAPTKKKKKFWNLKLCWSQEFWIRDTQPFLYVIKSWTRKTTHWRRTSFPSSLFNAGDGTQGLGHMLVKLSTTEPQPQPWSRYIWSSHSQGPPDRCTHREQEKRSSREGRNANERRNQDLHGSKRKITIWRRGGWDVLDGCHWLCTALYSVENARHQQGRVQQHCGSVRASALVQD